VACPLGHSACAFKKFLRLNCIKKASLKYSCPQIDISHEVLMIELAYFYLPQLENIFPPLRVAGKKWPFFSFSSGKKHPTTHDVVEEGCYSLPLGIDDIFSKIKCCNNIIWKTKYLMMIVLMYLIRLKKIQWIWF
jgi:hypothetical protein